MVCKCCDQSEILSLKNVFKCFTNFILILLDCTCTTEQCGKGCECAKDCKCKCKTGEHKDCCKKWKHIMVGLRPRLKSETFSFGIWFSFCNIVKTNFYGQINFDLLSHFRALKFCKTNSKVFYDALGNIFMAMKRYSVLLKVGFSIFEFI